jgi:ketosteroid isomerase-like protein
MAEMRGGGEMAAGGRWRAAMAEVFVMENGLIKERRAFVVPLTENEFK